MTNAVLPLRDYCETEWCPRFSKTPCVARSVETERGAALPELRARDRQRRRSHEQDLIFDACAESEVLVRAPKPPPMATPPVRDPFVRAAAYGALTDVSLARCRRGGSFGRTHIEVVFQPDVVIDEVRISDSTLNRACVEAQFHGVRVPPFAGGQDRRGEVVLRSE